MISIINMEYYNNCIKGCKNHYYFSFLLILQEMLMLNNYQEPFIIENIVFYNNTYVRFLG